MSQVANTLRILGDVARTHELLSAGVSPGLIRHAWASGDIIRVRKGVYASLSVSSNAIMAQRVGGRLGCASAAVERRLWVPEFDGLHVSVDDSSARLRDPHRATDRLVSDTAVVVHWNDSGSGGSKVSTGAQDAIAQIVGCHPLEFSYVVVESALRKGWLTPIDWLQLRPALPQRSRALFATAGRGSDSGTESMIKLMLIRLDIPFVQQAVIEGVGPVDFLVGSSLVIEADSKAYHSDPYKDRHKDAELSIRGFRTLRFMWSQVTFEREHVEAAILAAFLRGDHQ